MPETRPARGRSTVARLVAAALFPVLTLAAACGAAPPATPTASVTAATAPVALATPAPHAVQPARSALATPVATPTASPAPPPAAATVAGQFEGDFTVKAGTTVVFTNTDVDEPHTVTARDGSFDTGVIMPGQSVAITFKTPGVYPYFCSLHPNMLGTITVVR